MTIKNHLTNGLGSSAVVIKLFGRRKLDGQISPRPKKFLEEQLQWCKDQDFIFEEIGLKLYAMKKIAEYDLEHKFYLE
jgi:hypothetical protein